MCFLVLATVFIFACQAAKLPSGVGRCHVSDPELNGCLTKNVEIAIRKFKDGAPKLGIPRFEPLLIPKLSIGQGTGPVSVQQNLQNVEIHGLTKSKITKYMDEECSGPRFDDETQYVYSAELEQNKIYTESVTPRLEVLADYNMEGRVTILPVRGHGRCNITLINSKITHVLLGETHVKKGGRKHFRLTDYKVTIDPEHVSYKFDDLFDGDRRLGDEINHVLNENWDVLFADLRSGYEESFGQIFKTLANNLFARVPYDDVFLSA